MFYRLHNQLYSRVQSRYHPVLEFSLVRADHDGSYHDHALGKAVLQKVNSFKYAAHML